MALLDGSSCTLAVSHMCLPDLYCGVRVRGFEAGQEKQRWRNLSATSVNNSAGLSVLQTEVIFYSFIVLAAVAQPDVPGVGEQPPVSPLCCTEWMLAKQLTSHAVFMAPHCTMSHFSLKC